MATLKRLEVTSDGIAFRPGGIEKHYSQSIHVMVEPLNDNTDDESLTTKLHNTVREKQR